MQKLSSSHKRSAAITAIVVAVGLVASIALNAFLMMTMTTTPAYAAPKEQTVVREEGQLANANWDYSLDPLEVPELGSILGASLSVLTSTGTEGDTVIQVQLTLDTDGAPQCASGSAIFSPDVVNIDNRLQSATLSPVTLEVTIFDEFCSEPMGTAEITIQATWEGIGELLDGRTKIQDKNEFSMLKLSGRTQVREAIAEGSINGADLGTSQFAELRKSESRVMSVTPRTTTTTQ